jgi:hypothetical protein
LLAVVDQEVGVGLTLGRVERDSRVQLEERHD